MKIVSCFRQLVPVDNPDPFGGQMWQHATFIIEDDGTIHKVMVDGLGNVISEIVLKIGE